VVLNAQVFGARPSRPRTGARLLRLVDRLHAVQIDPVNVLVRAHYFPAFSRLGAYSTSAFDRLVDGSRLFEAMVHDASIVPVRMWPLLQWRMAAQRADPRTAARYPAAMLDALAERVGKEGPVTVADLTDGPRVRGEGRGPFGATTWTVNPVASGLRRLWAQGRVAVAGRRGIERVFDLPERVLPADVLTAPAVHIDDARRELLQMAGRAFGVGTAKDLADYFRLGSGVSGTADRHGGGLPVGQLLRDLVDAGDLVECTVEGWRQTAYLDPKAKWGPAGDCRTLVSPFDSLLWGRERIERLFGFRYKIEIYTPQPMREYGYYVLPFLLGENLVGRVDLKADRASGELLVQGSFVEAGIRPGVVASELASELEDIASWLGLERVRVRENGDLAKPLTRAVRARGLRG